MISKGVVRWLAVALTLVCIVDFQLYRMAEASRRHALEDAEATLRVATDVVLARAEQLLDTYDRVMAGIGEVVSLRGNTIATSDLYLHRLLVRSHRITPGLRWLFVLREDGQLADNSTSFPAPRLDLSDREYYRIQVANWERNFYIGPAIAGRTDQVLFIPLSRRIVNDGSRFIGVVAAGIDPDELVHLLSDQALPAGFTLRLLLRNGRSLACLPAKESCLDDDWHAAPLFLSLLPRAPRNEHHHIQLFDELPGPAAYASSDTYPVVVAARLDEAKVLAPWRRNLEGYIAITLIGNLAFIGISFFAFRQFQRRQQAMDQLAEANLRLEERVSARTDQLRQSEARARTFINTAMDAVVVIDGESRVVEFNKAAERMFGFAADEVIGHTLDMLMPDDIAESHHNHVHAANESSAIRAMGRGREVVARRKDGELFPIEVTVGSTGVEEPHLHVGIIRDISERKAMEDELLRLATTDGLTGVLNRRAFSDKAERLINLAHRHQRPFSLLVLDADKFKGINDRYGHPAGDAVLKALSSALQSTLRGTDLLGRLGGEEFGIALPETSRAGAEELGERLLEAVRACRVPCADESLAFTVSAGLATLDKEGDNLATLLKRADDALYRAKAAGRDRLVGPA